MIGREDFFTVPSTAKVSDFIEQLKGKEMYKLSIHFACGMGTYIFRTFPVRSSYVLAGIEYFLCVASLYSSGITLNAQERY